LIRKAVYVNLAVASFVLLVTSIVFVTSPSQLFYRGWLDLLESAFVWALALLPPIQVAASAALLLSSRESRKSPLVWLLLLVTAFSLVSGFFVLAGIAGVSAAP